jgi:hypothetical protein
MLTLLIFTAVPAPALANGDGGGYWLPGHPAAIDIDAQDCRTRTWSVEPGKSGTGSKATATDGCHVYEFTTTNGQRPDSGEVTFKTSHVFNGWEDGNTLPSMAGGYCAYAAAHQANLAFVNFFGVPDGTEVRVRYSCD